MYCNLVFTISVSGIKSVGKTRYINPTVMLSVINIQLCIPNN